MQRYYDSVLVQGASGGLQPYPQAQVSVFVAGTSTLATLYSNNTGATQQNPFRSTEQGVIAFYAEDGRYDIEVKAAGFTSVKVRDILLEDAIDEGYLKEPDIEVKDGVIDPPAGWEDVPSVGKADGVGGLNAQALALVARDKETLRRLADATDPSNGAGMVAFRQSGSGSQARPLAEKVGETSLSITDYMTEEAREDIHSGNAEMDHSEAVQAALDAAYTLGGRTVKVPSGSLIRHDSPLRLRPGVSIEVEGNGGRFRDDPAEVSWDYRGADYAFYNDEMLGPVNLILGEINFDNNESPSGTVDGVKFIAGITDCYIDVAIKVSTATNNGVVICGKNPITDEANNNQYRNRLLVKTGGEIEAPGVALWLQSDDTVNSRCNANTIVAGTRFDAFATGWRVCGNGNTVEGMTVNGPCSNTMIHAEGNNTFGNTVYGLYNDANATGYMVTLDNKAATDRMLLQIINPVNHIALENIQDISTGSGNAYLGVLQASLSGGLAQGQPRYTTFAPGRERNWIFNLTDMLSGGRVCFGNSALANQAVRTTAAVSGSATQEGVHVGTVYGSDATSAIGGVVTTLTGGNSGSAYTTSIVALLRAQSFNSGTNQTVTNLYGARIDALGGATNVYGVWSAIADGANCWNFYAFGDAPNRFQGTITTVGSYNATTSNDANVNIAGNGLLQRSTSSIRYKRDVEDMDDSRADALLDLRPVWYRSKCEGDRPDWSWYGLIAEEVAQVDPRLVHWGHPMKEVEQEIDKCDADGNVIGVEKVNVTVPDTDAPLQAEGVQYARLVVPLLNLVRRLEARISALESN